jgi:LysR family glycine cleavage system transcriptional activator
MNKKPRHSQLARLSQAALILDAIGRVRSFSNAAEELGIQQSAISHRIRGLEEALGLKLFERTTRVVELTRSGVLLCEASSRALLHLRQALDAAGTIADGSGLRISAPSSLAMKWLLPLLPAAHEDGLDLSLDVREDFTDLAVGHADAAIRFGKGPYPGLRSIKLSSCDLQPVASPSYLARFGGRQPDLTSDAVILLADRAGEKDGTGFSWANYVVPDARKSRAMMPAHYFDRADLMIQAAVAGLGVALGRTLLIEGDLKHGHLRTLGPALPMTSAYWLVCRPELAGSDRIKALESWLKKRIAATARAPLIRGRQSP